MKTIEAFFIGLLATLVLAACQDDTETAVPYTNGESANVKFELDASSLHQNSATRTFSPSYAKNGFSIYAFKQVEGGTDYVFSQSVTLDGMNYTAQDQKLIGSANLPIGKYKFVPAYGLVNQSSVINVPTWTTLTNDLTFSYATTSLMDEIFLSTDKEANDLTEYSLGLDATANSTVTATLKRAVARVDVMFISAEKDGDGYSEKAYEGEGGNIFADKQLELVELRYKNINNAMTVFGKNATQTRENRNFQLNTLNYNEPDSKVTVGNGAATLVGQRDYTRYDNVQESDVISGSAHIFGNYLFPNDNGDKIADLDIYIKPVGGTGRVITITQDAATKLPLEQNKVTLVKVYVLNDNNVFSTTVDFEVEIETVWEDANEVNSSIS